MVVVLIKDKVKKEDLIQAQQEYGEYIKVVADLKSGIIAIGGEWHVDAEKLLIENGSYQENIWGGGIDLVSQMVEPIALINIRPKQGNDSQEILDQPLRQQFINLVKEKFALWIKD